MERNVLSVVRLVACICERTIGNINMWRLHNYVMGCVRAVFIVIPPLNGATAPSGPGRPHFSRLHDHTQTHHTR
jgi:hypothetical protein